MDIRPFMVVAVDPGPSAGLICLSNVVRHMTKSTHVPGFLIQERPIAHPRYTFPAAERDARASLFTTDPLTSTEITASIQEITEETDPVCGSTTSGWLSVPGGAQQVPHEKLISEVRSRLEVEPLMAREFKPTPLGQPGYRLILAVERFVVGARSARSAHSHASQIVRDQVGALLQLAADCRVEVHLRRPADVMTWASDARLMAAGLLPITRGKKDARAAARHALFSAVVDCAWPDPLRWNSLPNIYTGQKEV